MGNFEEIELSNNGPMAGRKNEREKGHLGNELPPQQQQESPAGRNTFVMDILHKFYRRWAKLVVKHRNVIMLICSILPILGTIKIVNTPFANDINGFTPYGVRALTESAIRDQFFNSSGGTFGVFLLILPKKGGGNMLSVEMLEEVMRVDDMVSWNITLHNHGTNKQEAFSEFCADFCNINEPVRLFLQGLKTKQRGVEIGNEDEEGQIELDYPSIRVGGQRMNIQPYFHGIAFRHQANVSQSLGPNSSANKSSFPSNMAAVEMVALVYKAERGVPMLSDAEVKDYELRVSRHFENEFRSELVRVLSISTSYVEAEFVRAALSMLPFLGLGFAVMLLCTGICIPLSAAYFQQATVHKISLSIVACLCPFMASGTALGLLFLFGLRFSPILCATPFLVLAIGVDDAFLQTHAWNRISGKRKSQRQKKRNGANGTKSGESKEGKQQQEEEEERADQAEVADLVALVLMDTGPAILVSALANILADAVGALIASPEITLLCIGNMTALAFDFLFQCSYFLAVMATVALIERKQARKSWGTSKVNDVNSKTAAIGYEKNDGKWRLGKKASGGEKHQQKKEANWQIKFRDSLKKYVAQTVDFYVNFVTNRVAAGMIAFCWAVFIGISVIGITRFEVNMTTRQLYAGDSPLLEIDSIRENRINPFYTQVTVFVNNPGNLSSASGIELERVNKLVDQMEHMRDSWGPRSTMYFVRDFEQYSLAADDGNGTNYGRKLDCEHLKEFMEMPEYEHWKGFVRFNSDGGNESSCRLGQFYFTTAFHGPELSRWSERVKLLDEWREKVDGRSGQLLNASVFHEEAIYLDLMHNMPTDTWQSALATLLCMALICALMLQNLGTVAVTTAVIAAIITGTLGTLSWSGVALNQLMMGSLVICIGFSVDLPAHFSYHFLASEHASAAGDNPLKARLRSAIKSVGLPSILASLSTGLCVLTHAWVQLYIAQVFVRTMCLTICLCLLHTLLVLPAMLTLADFVAEKMGRTALK